MAADRAYLAGGRVGDARAALDALTRAVLDRFEAAGCSPVDPAALHPAETLLDVYGEDLRARAFIVEEPGGGELALRPDFTVPVLLLHRAAPHPAARYAYLGPVWRRQAPGSRRPTEYLQAGFEIYGGDAAEVDAECLSLALGALEEGGVGAPAIATGDLGLVVALLDATPMDDRRRAALKRHFWRPARFQALLRRYAAPAADPGVARAALLEVAGDAEAVAALAEAAGEPVGARTLDEVAARAAALAAERALPPLPAEIASALDAAFAVEAPAEEALARFDALARGLGVSIERALDRFARRLDALARRGIDGARLPFRAVTARTLEYYDGFVFELAAPGRSDLPPLAGGGRYDGLASALGGAAEPACGAMVRPEALLAAAGEAPC